MRLLLCVLLFNLFSHSAFSEILFYPYNPTFMKAYWTAKANAKKHKIKSVTYLTTHFANSLPVSYNKKVVKYDKEGNQIEIWEYPNDTVNPAKKIYKYDKLGKPLEVVTIHIDPTSKPDTGYYSYDRYGNQIRKDYDLIYDEKKRPYLYKHNFDSTKYMRIKYDKYSRIIEYESISHLYEKRTFIYDSKGNVVVDINDNGLSLAIDSNKYDKNNKLIWNKYKGGISWEFTMEYDKKGREIARFYKDGYSMIWILPKKGIDGMYRQKYYGDRLVSESKYIYSFY